MAPWYCRVNTSLHARHDINNINFTNIVLLGLGLSIWLVWAVTLLAMKLSQLAFVMASLLLSYLPVPNLSWLKVCFTRPVDIVLMFLLGIWTHWGFGDCPSDHLDFAEIFAGHEKINTIKFSKPGLSHMSRCPYHPWCHGSGGAEIAMLRCNNLSWCFTLMIRQTKNALSMKTVQTRMLL